MLRAVSTYCLLYTSFRRENYAVELDNGNLRPEAGKRFFIMAAKTQIHPVSYTHLDVYKRQGL